MDYLSHQKSIIAEFNQLPETIFLQSLLDIRASGTEVFVPDRYTHLVQSPTTRELHYNLTRMLLEHPLLPASADLSVEMKEIIGLMKETAPYSDQFDNYHLIKADTSFWPVTLALNRGASGLYQWEHNLYRLALNDYLIGLQNVLMQCQTVIPTVKEGFMYIPSLCYLLLPLRFWLGGTGNDIYGHETIFYDYIAANYPMINFYLFKGGDVSPSIRINPFIVEHTINGYTKIKNDLERNIVHDPCTLVDSSYKEGSYSIYWWFPKPLATKLDQLVRESKVAKEINIISITRDEDELPVAAELPVVEDVIENTDFSSSPIMVSNEGLFEPLSPALTEGD